MHRVARWFLFYLVSSVAIAPLHILLSLPYYPRTALGWLAFLAIPVPLALAGDWLFEYRPLRLLRPIDAWATRIEESPHRLLVVVGLIAAAGALGLGLMALRSMKHYISLPRPLPSFVWVVRPTRQTPNPSFKRMCLRHAA